MAFGHPIQLRLNPETQRACEEAAALQGKPFSSYLRERLETSVAHEAELSALRQDVASLRQCVDSLIRRAGNAASTEPLLLEILLMLRAADAAAQALGLSRRQVYVLIRRARQGKTPPLWISCARRLPKREFHRNFCHIMSLSDPLRF